MHDQPRRLRSSAVSLGLVGALALSLSACGTSGASATRRCVDANNVRQTDSAYQLVEDDKCLTSPGPSTAGGFGTTPHYRHYYGGLVTSGFVSGGSFTIPRTSSSRRWYNPGSWRSSSSTSSASNNSSTRQSGVTTGGFGSSSGSKSSSS
jgi:hypothetical protein